jgi:hypothetical protein
MPVVVDPIDRRAQILQAAQEILNGKGNPFELWCKPCCKVNQNDWSTNKLEEERRNYAEKLAFCEIILPFNHIEFCFDLLNYFSPYNALSIHRYAHSLNHPWFCLKVDKPVREFHEKLLPESWFLHPVLLLESGLAQCKCPWRIIEPKQNRHCEKKMYIIKIYFMIITI